MAVTEINATARPRAGKGAARAVRRAGRVPGVIYGNNQPPVPISVDDIELRLIDHGTEPDAFARFRVRSTPYLIAVDADGRIVEHWDVLQTVPDQSANDNGMF